MGIIRSQVFRLSLNWTGLRAAVLGKTNPKGASTRARGTTQRSAIAKIASSPGKKSRKMAITENELAFIKHYSLDGNGTAADSAAGHSE